MKKVLFALILGSLAAAAFAQDAGGGLPENSVVLGTHIIKGADLTCADPLDERPPLTNVTPVVVSLINPNATSKVAGVQARLTYDASLFEFINPAPAGNKSCQSAGAGTVISGAAPIINYETPVGNVGAVNFALAKETGTTNSGTLVTFFVRVKAGAAAGASGDFAFDLSNNGEKFVVAPETGTATKNAVNGKLIVAGTGDNSVDLGAAFSSASTDGTKVYAVDNRGALFVSTPGGATLTAAQTPANRTGAPTEGRPVLRDAKVYIVSTNGKVQAFDAAAATVPSLINPAAAVTLPANATVRSTPAVAAGKIIFTDSAGGVHSVDAATGGTPAESTGVTASATSSPAVVGAAGAERVAVGGTNSVIVLNAADLTPVANVTITTGGVVSSSPFVNGDGIGFVGDDTGRVTVFNVATGVTIGAAETGEGVKSSPFGNAAGALVVGVNGKVSFVTALGAALPGTITLAPPVAPPVGTELFGVQQGPVVRGTTALVGDSVGNLYQIGVIAGVVTAGPVRNFGSGAITSLASAADGQVSFLISRTNLINTTYTP